MQNAYTTIYLFKHHLSRFFPGFSYYFHTKKANTEIFVKKTHKNIWKKQITGYLLIKFTKHILLPENKQIQSFFYENWYCRYWSFSVGRRGARRASAEQDLLWYSGPWSHYFQLSLPFRRRKTLFWMSRPSQNRTFERKSWSGFPAGQKLFFTENFSQVPGFVGVEKISEKSSARYTDFHRMLVQLFCAVFCAQCQNRVGRS